jgi:hypothetical protein
VHKTKRRAKGRKHQSKFFARSADSCPDSSRRKTSTVTALAVRFSYRPVEYTHLALALCRSLNRIAAELPTNKGWREFGLSVLLYPETNDASRQPPLVAPVQQQRESEKSKRRSGQMAQGPRCRVPVGARREHLSLLANQSLEAQPRMINPVNTLIEGRKSAVYCQQQLSIRNGGSGSRNSDPDRYRVSL